MNDQNCIFCKIIAGEIPSYKIWEDDDFYAFLSIAPHTPGHTLIIPKAHTDYFFDLNDSLLEKIILVAKPLATAIKTAFAPTTGKVGVVVAGLEVPHAHMHLIGMSDTGDLDFSRAKQVAPDELAANQKKLVELISA